ncbi:hypothetical protein BDW75DRAFT_224493 [Aspergillus navahoensis]
MSQGMNSTHPPSSSVSVSKSPRQQAAGLSASQTGRTENDPWKLVATSSPTLERPAVASPIAEPWKYKRVAVGIEPTSNTATATATSELQTGISQESEPTSQTRSPPRSNPTESSLSETRAPAHPTESQTSLQPLLPDEDTPGNGTTGPPPKRPSLADELQTDVNRYMIGIAEKIQALETRLEQSLADNAILEGKLRESLDARNETDNKNTSLIRQAEELTKDKRKLEEELRKVEGVRDAVKQLDITGMLDVLRSWTSNSIGTRG